MYTSTPNSTVDTSRRFTLKAMSILPFLGYGLMSLGKTVRAASDLACTLASELTQGPYWVDEKLNRADITTNTTRASVLNGLPLELTLQIFNNSGSSCGVTPVANVQIDIWHTDAAGEYSDVSGNGQSSTKGQTFLRGYQVTDSHGYVTFKTIYPGWYSGRTVHIHLRARAYDASGNTTYNFTTQLFFDDAVSNSVYKNSPYNARGTRDTLNSVDSIYNQASPPILVSLASKNTGGYSGMVAIGLANLPSSIVGTTTSTAGVFAVTTVNSGTTAVPTLTSTLTVNTADVGTTGNIYVAAELSGNWYFNVGNHWENYTDTLGLGTFPSFYSGTLSNNHSLPILSSIDVSALGPVNFYVGYGQTAQDMLQKNQYKKTYSL